MSRVLDVRRFSITAEDLQMSLTFDEDEHPRDKNGKFIVKSGTGKTYLYPANPATMKHKPEWKYPSHLGWDGFDEWNDKIQADSDHQAFQETRKNLGEHAMEIVQEKIYEAIFDPKANVTTEQGQAYAEAASKVFDYMPPKALYHFIRRVKGVKLYSNTAKLNMSLFGAEERSGGGVALAAWANSDGHGVLHLDGGYEETSQNSRGIYAHEFGHVVDWIDGATEKTEHGEYSRPGRRISWTNEWREAFSEEIADPQLSNYATTSHSEGFAEFARLAWTEPRRARDDFPKCYAIFKQYELV